MKKKLARGVALTAVALIGLVPIQASPASAFVGSLDVEPENVLRITNSIQRYTATVTGVTPLNGHQIAYDDDDIPLNDTNACMTSTSGTCSFMIRETAATSPTELRVYVKDPEPPATPCNSPIPTPGDNCDAAEPLAQVDADDTDVVQLEYKDGTLDVTETPPLSFAPGATVNLTATVKSTETVQRALVANVDAEIISSTASPSNANKNATDVDMECDTDPVGVCTLSYVAGSGSGVDTVRAWIDLNEDNLGTTATTDDTGDETDTTNTTTFEGDKDEGANEAATPGTPTTEPDRTDVAEVNISATQSLDVGPETQTKVTNTLATFTATVNLGNTVQSGIKIAAAIDSGGPNVGKAIASCTTGLNGQCSMSYTGTAVGTDKVRFGVDDDGNGLPNEADSTEDLTGSGTQEGGTKDPDKTDVVQVTWTAPTPPPTPEPTPDPAKCEQAKRNVAKAKKVLKKAKASGDESDIKKAKRRLRRAKKRKVAACAG